MLKKAQSVVASGEVDEIVDLAIQHHRRKLASEAELDILKAKLREVARERGSETSLVELEGKLGVATVVMVDDNVRVRKGMDLKDIEENLPREVFLRLFVKTVQVVPGPDFLGHVRRLASSNRAVLDHFMDISPATPKVNLPR
jgi:hypothetical protein